MNGGEWGVSEDPLLQFLMPYRHHGMTAIGVQDLMLNEHRRIWAFMPNIPAGAQEL